MPRSLRASLIFLQISGCRFVTTYIMDYYSGFNKGEVINSYQQVYQLINSC